MSKKIYLYVENHKNTKGIQIHINFIKRIFNNYQIILTKKIIKNSTTIFIENFSNQDVKNIIKSKSQENIRIILILTEFFNEKAKIFNCFELDKNIYKYIPFQFFSAINIYLFLNFFIIILFFVFSEIVFFYFLILLNIYFILKKIGSNRFLRIKYYKNKTSLYKYILYKYKFDIKKTPIYNFLKFIEYMLFYSIVAFIRNIRNAFFYRKFVIYQYFKERYLNCKKIIKHSNLILVTHPEIFKKIVKENKKVYFLYPYIKKFKPNLIKNKNFIFKFSGEFSHYRKKFFNNMFNKLEKNNVVNLEIKNYMKYFEKNIRKKRVGSFIDISNKKRFCYSFHPRKNNIWHFSSPIRYLEAIEKGEIPIVSDKFNDFFSKNLSININSLLDKNKNFKKNYFFNVNLINKKLKNYNKFSKINIKKLKKNIF